MRSYRRCQPSQCFLHKGTAQSPTFVNRRKAVQSAPSRCGSRNNERKHFPHRRDDKARGWTARGCARAIFPSRPLSTLCSDARSRAKGAAKIFDVIAHDRARYRGFSIYGAAARFAEFVNCRELFRRSRNGTRSATAAES